MDVNYGSISGQVVEYGYTGAYTGGGVTYPYQLTSHIANPDPNSVLKSANFATTDTPIEFRIISDFDSAKMVVDWQAFSDNQLWGDDINTLAAVTVNATADTTDSATIGWKTPDGTTGQFTATVNITEPAADTTPDQFDLGANVTGAEPGATTQRTFVLAGIDSGETVSVTATGSATASPSTAQVGDTITVELTAGTYEAVVSGGVSIGGVSDSFSVTSRVAPDISPDAFTVTALTGQEPDTLVEFAPVTVAGIDSGEQIEASVSGASVEYAVDAGAGYGGWTFTATNVELGYAVKARIRTSASFETEKLGTLVIGDKQSALSATTRAAVLPTQDVVIPDLSLGETDAVSIDLNNYFSGANSYSLTGIPAGSGLSFSGSVLSGNVNKDDIAASPYTLTATAFSADGSIQDVFEVVVVDDIAPSISIYPLTTLDTSPIVSGSAGDATSLTLVVNGQTYTPTPSGGAWSQQLPTLALGDYAMTLNGEDAAGNAAVEASGTLRVVDEIPVMRGRPGFTINFSMGF